MRHPHRVADRHRHPGCPGRSNRPQPVQVRQ
jgi:hypothetical protein